MARVDDAWMLKRLKPGAEVETKTLPGNKDARYIDIETAECNTFGIYCHR